jgi:hypothetical protein
MVSMLTGSSGSRGTCGAPILFIGLRQPSGSVSRCIVFQAEFSKGAEFLAAKLNGAASKVTRAAGVQVDADPLAQIVGLVDFQIGRLGEKEVRFHSVGARISE